MIKNRYEALTVVKKLPVPLNGKTSIKNKKIKGVIIKLLFNEKEKIF